MADVEVVHLDLFSTQVNDSAESFEHRWNQDGRTDTIPVWWLWDENQSACAPLGEVSTMGSFASGSMISGFVGARLLRRSEDLWLAMFGDEDRSHMVVRTIDPKQAIKRWFTEAQNHLIDVNWSAVILANALDLMSGWPCESPGAFDAAIFADLVKPNDAVELSGIDVSFSADEVLYPKDWLIQWVSPQDEWLKRVTEPGSDEQRIWNARRDAWLAHWGWCPDCLMRPRAKRGKEQQLCVNAADSGEVVYVGEWAGSLVAVTESARARAAKIRLRSEGDGDDPDWEAVAHNDSRDPKHVTTACLPWLSFLGTSDSGWSITYYSEADFLLDPSYGGLAMGVLRHHGYEPVVYDFPKDWPRAPRRRTRSSPSQALGK